MGRGGCECSYCIERVMEFKDMLFVNILKQLMSSVPSLMIVNFSISCFKCVNVLYMEKFKN